jgi:hypothetical protein
VKIGHIIPFLNQALTLSAALRGSSPYMAYCLVAARQPSRFHLDLEMELACSWTFFLLLGLAMSVPLLGGNITACSKQKWNK